MSSLTRILVLLCLLGSCWGVLIIGPKFVQSNQNCTVVISNFYKNFKTVHFILQMEGKSHNFTNEFSVTKYASVASQSNSAVHFSIPTIVSPADIKLTIDGQRGFSFHHEEHLVYHTKSISGLIQINKSVFYSDDTVKFRVIVLDTDLKPPASVESINVTIRDPQQNVADEWSFAKLSTGMFQDSFPLDSTQLLGIWNISVQVEGEEPISKTFEVKNNVMSFDVQVMPTTVPLLEHQALNLTIAASYHRSLPVRGVANVELYLNDDILDQVKEFYVNGSRQVQLRFNQPLQLKNDQDFQNVRVKVQFTRQFTNQTAMKEQRVPIFKYPYRATLAEDCKEFRSNQPIECAVRMNFHDGSPVQNVSFLVTINGKGVEGVREYFSDQDGIFTHVMHPESLTKQINLTISEKHSGFSFSKIICLESTVTNVFINVQLMSDIQLNRPINLMVTCNERMKNVFYYVVSKRNIVKAGVVRQTAQTNAFFQIYLTKNMIPEATIFVATQLDGALVWDSLKIDLKQQREELEIYLNQSKFKSGHEIELQLKGPPDAYVSLTGYNKAFLELSKFYDLLRKDDVQHLQDFHQSDSPIAVAFYKMGMFAVLSRDIQVSNTQAIAEHLEIEYEPPALLTANTGPVKTNAVESWLLETVTLDQSGRYTLYEEAPDATTTWQLLGFSIDPVYGLEIIKKPIQFTTVQPFVIVEYLPHSVRQGKVSSLNFLLFNNLEEEYDVDVTLDDINSGMVNFGCNLGDKYFTQTVRVPPKGAVPITFMVTLESFEKIRVNLVAYDANGTSIHEIDNEIKLTSDISMPKHIASRYFCLETSKSLSFSFDLDIGNDTDPGSGNIEFRLYPNIATVFQMTTRDPDNLCWLLFFENFLDVFINNSSPKTKFMNQINNQSEQVINGFYEFNKTEANFISTVLTVDYEQLTSKQPDDMVLLERAWDWIVSKQQSSGLFEEDNYEIENETQGGLDNRISLSSFILVTLLENENAKVKHAAVIQRGINLAEQLQTIESPFDLSLATYAMMLDGHEMKNAALKKLLYMSTVLNNGEERFWNTTYSYETTCYALLSFTMSDQFEESIPITRWLVNNLFEIQSTLQNNKVGMKALYKITQMVSTTRNNYTTKLMYQGSQTNFHINSSNINIKSFDNFPRGTNSINVTVEGVGCGVLEVSYQ